MVSKTNRPGAILTTLLFESASNSVENIFKTKTLQCMIDNCNYEIVGGIRILIEGDPLNQSCTSLYFGLLFSKTRHHLRCNLLFGLIGHVGLLKDVKILKTSSFRF